MSCGRRLSTLSAQLNSREIADSEEILTVVGPPEYDFMFDLVVDPDCADSERIGEYRRAELERLASEWADDEGLSADAQDTLLQWVANLPWQDGRITFEWRD